MDIRGADFAGSWYPGNESECRAAIEEFSHEAVPCPGGEARRVGGIVPHAGWFFSGKVAFSVLRCLKRDVTPDTIIIMGRHLHPGSPNYLMKEGSWSTPLGDLEIDNDLAEKLDDEFPFQIETAHRYEQDNTIEVQLPFIRYLYPHSMIVPMGLPPAMASIRIGERVAEIATAMGRTVLVVGSTDLTHYGSNYGHTPKGTGKEAVEWVKNENDRKMVDLMVAMETEKVINESLIHYNACCSGAVASAIASMKVLGARKGETLLYTTSYDIRPGNSFVGYAGIVY